VRASNPSQPPISPEPLGRVTKSELALALVELRTHAGLTQAQLARRAEWPNSVACRLEAPHGPLPDLASLACYARACDLEAGFLFAVPEGAFLHIHSALTLQSALRNHPFERFHGEPIELTLQIPP
jgi:transcriptional regulator with XRE-family HTH domain